MCSPFRENCLYKNLKGTYNHNRKIFVFQDYQVTSNKFDSYFIKHQSTFFIF